MDCIFCKKAIKDNQFFCQNCEKIRLQQISISSPADSSEGKSLLAVVENTYKIVGHVFQDSLNYEFIARKISGEGTDCIHVLPLVLSAEKQYLSSYHDNAKRWSTLTIENLLNPLRSQQHGQLHFWVNQYPIGLRLSDILAEDIDLPFIWGLRIIRSICFLLKSIHAKGFVHSNVKPSSIFINFQGRLQLSNIGLFDRYPEKLFEQKILRDISLYASPEQLMRQCATVKSDLYSFSLIAYRLLTGVHPFMARKQINVLYKNLHENVIPALAINPVIPSELNDLLMRNLSKTANDRSESIDEFLDILTIYLRDELERSLGSKELEDTNVDNVHLQYLIDEGKNAYFERDYERAIELWDIYLKNDQANFAVQQYKKFAQYRLQTLSNGK